MGAAVIDKRDLLLSIRPNYADMIIDGTKTVELRRRFANGIEAGALLVIYSTSPKQSIIGSARVKTVERMRLKALWKTHGKSACILKVDFDTYFAGLTEGYAVVLESAKAFRRPIAAADLRKKFGFVAPQSFMYLPKEYYRLLKNEQL
jgi:predicted transcriptional regulator